MIEGWGVPAGIQFHRGTPSAHVTRKPLRRSAWSSRDAVNAKPTSELAEASTNISGTELLLFQEKGMVEQRHGIEDVEIELGGSRLAEDYRRGIVCGGGNRIDLGLNEARKRGRNPI